jgi:hypothetical protein
MNFCTATTLIAGEDWKQGSCCISALGALPGGA